MEIPPRTPTARKIARLPTDGKGEDYRFRPLKTASEPVPVEEGTELERLRQEARRAYWSGDPVASERLYLKLLERFPDDADLHGELGNVRFQLGDRAGAVAAYRQAIRLLAPVSPERARRLAERVRRIETEAPDAGAAPSPATTR